MASLKLIKRRIRTTRNIAQITRAMEMVAALKMRRAQEQALRSRPYTEKATQILANFAKGTPIELHPLFTSPPVLKGEKEKIVFLLVTPNRGLCGSLATNLFRELSSFLEKVQDKERAFVSYGKRGRFFLMAQGLTILADIEAPEPPSFEKAADLFRILREGFLAGQFQKVFLSYNHFESTMRQTPLVLPLLPLSRETVVIEETRFNYEYLFEPSTQVLFDAFLPHFLEMKIYHALLEAFASEQSARMMAMRSATENAQEIMAELTLLYNKERQQQITNEISDIVTAQLGLEAR